MYFAGCKPDKKRLPDFQKYTDILRDLPPFEPIAFTQTMVAENLSTYREKRRRLLELRIKVQVTKQARLNLLGFLRVLPSHHGERRLSGNERTMVRHVKLSTGATQATKLQSEHGCSHTGKTSRCECPTSSWHATLRRGRPTLRQRARYTDGGPLRCSASAGVEPTPDRRIAGLGGGRD